MKHYRYAIFISLLLFCVGLAQGQTGKEWTPQMLEMPMAHQSDNFIADPADILSSAAKGKINGIIGQCRKNGSVELAVAVVPNTGGETIEEFADAVFEGWGIGKKDVDNGVLLTISMDDKKVNIRTGYGMEGVLTDALCSQIIRHVFVPNMRKDGINAATVATVYEIVEVVTNSSVREELLSKEKENTVNGVGAPLDSNVLWDLFGYVAIIGFAVTFVLFVVTLNQTRGKDNYGKALIWHKRMPALWGSVALSCGTGVVIALIAMLIVWHIRKRKIKCDVCGNEMDKLNEDASKSYLEPGQVLEQQLHTVDYDVWVCPDCHSVKRFPFRRFQSKYTECPNCHVIARHKKSEKVLVQPTPRTEGLTEEVWECEYCHNQNRMQRRIPRKKDAAIAAAGAAAAVGAARRAGGYGGSGGFSGGAGGFGGFGGGSSGGGGASGGW